MRPNSEPNPSKTRANAFGLLLLDAHKPKASRP